MKHLLTIVLTLTLLTCCTTPGRREAMRRELDSINMRNRADQPFTTADVQPYVDFFDRHGTPNDRLLAHYLLGRAYHEQGEAPMALQCYQQAIDCADTTAKDCDYAQMSRVYSQMAEVYYYQWLHTQAIEAYKRAIQYSHLSGDEALMINNYEQMCSAYEAKGEIDSAKWAIDKVITWYDKHGATKYAAISKGRAVSILLKAPCNYTMAHQYIAEYERHSGYFDKEGNILDGCEIFYYYKALLFMEQDKLDSAEYWFRKELHDGRDFNNQNGGAMGLATVYEQRHMPDSAAKYYKYAYAMNDSMYAQMATATVSRMQAMYDYSRHQEMARSASDKATMANMRLLVCLIVLLVISLLASWLYIARKRVIEEMQAISQALGKARNELARLREDTLTNQQAICEKEKRIRQLEKAMGRYGKLVFFGSERIENDLRMSDSYKSIKDMAVRGQKLTADEWRLVYEVFAEYFPVCHDFCTSTMEIDTIEYRVSMLLRLHFETKEIANMSGVTPPYISKVSTKVLKDHFGKRGSSKDLAKELNKMG